MNPPAEELDPLARRHGDFLLHLADYLPRVAIEQVKVDPLGEGVVRVTVKVINRGYLPTAPAIAEMSRQHHPVQIKLEAPEGTKFITGYPRTQLDTLAGSGGAAEKTYLLRLSAGKHEPAPEKRRLTARAYSPSIGEDSQTVELP